jgi:YHS domain-containing protein
MGCPPKLCTINAELVGGAVSSVTLPVFTKQFESNGAAINGTDPVVYFTMSKPVQGSADHAFNWNGVTWHFASGENQQIFERNPDKYAHQYGGHCAYAMSKEYIAPTVLQVWTIYEDRLYLNFSLRARELWLQDVPGNIALGDANWPKLKY